MKRELLKRRKLLCDLSCSGITIQAAAEKITKDVVDPLERQRLIAAIRNDWSKRRSWIRGIQEP